MNKVMKYLKFYENKTKDIDPFDEENWDEVDDSRIIGKYYYMLKQGDIIETKNCILKERNSNDNGYELVDKNGERMAYIDKNFDKLMQLGYLLLKTKRNDDKVVITNNEELYRRILDKWNEEIENN